MTYTYAILAVSEATYNEIYEALERAGYSDQFHDDRDGVVIDCHGLALAKKEPDKACEHSCVDVPGGTPLYCLDCNAEFKDWDELDAARKAVA